MSLDSTHFSLLYEGGCLLNRYENDAAALAHFRSVCENACDEQDKLLRQIIKENSGTEFGKAHGFSGISDYGDYIENVPVLKFRDYEDSIGRIINGERNILTKAPPAFYNISSGSTGEQKLIPICRKDIDLQKLYFEDTIRGIISEAIPHGSEDELFGDIFAVTDVFMTEMPDGTPVGVRSGIRFQTAVKEGKLDCSVYCVPKEAMFPDIPEKMTYVKVRFALADPNVTAIHGVFAHSMSPVFRFILDNWNELLDDTEKGTVNSKFDVSDHWRSYLEKNLPPAPERASYLRSLPVEDLENNMMKKIWPKLKYIKLINGDIFGTRGSCIERMIGDVPVHSFALAASESIMGIAAAVSLKNRYVLLPDACFFEFMHINKLGEPGDIVPMGKVEIGERYDLILTTVSGLYRYDLGDIINVTGKYGNAPEIEICYRKEIILSIAEEKLNTQQFENAMHDFLNKTGISAEGYFISGNYDTFPPSYDLFIETQDDINESFPGLFDRCMCDSSSNYRTARERLDIGSPAITKIAKDTIMKYDEKRRKDGKRTDQSKPLRIVNDKKRILWFEQFKEEKIYGS